MRPVFSIGPWLMDLFNPPPRDSLSLVQKSGRALLVVVTLVTLCIISALVLSLFFFIFQRSREVLVGIPQLEYVLTILFVSIAVNVVCVMILFQIKKLDRKLIPDPGSGMAGEISLPAGDESTRESNG
jgi:hypothetical protein